MEMNLKLITRSDLENRDLIERIDDGDICTTKVTTNALHVEMDNKDQRLIKSIKGIKMIVKLKEGCIILKGNLGCSFTQPFGGEFFVRKAILDLTCDYNTTKGVEIGVFFTSNPMTNDSIRSYLEKIVETDEFVFNIKQFDDFMYIFGFYKKLSEELNNSASYKIIGYSSPYFYVPVSEKGLYGLDGELLDNYRSLEEVNDSNGILKGYRVEEYTYELMPNNLKESIEELIDIILDKEENQFRQLQKMYNNIYISNHRDINQKTSRDLIHLNIINIFKDKKRIVIQAIFESSNDYKFLNLYDMGQKVKVDSIEESLRLIKQGNSGSAIELLSYLIGEDPMPNNVGRTTKITQKYTEELNESQKRAFLKAIDGSPVTLIKGPPGTGKTHVINAITQYITKELNEKVVISSQTHVAIDNVLDKLMENHDLVVPNRITNRKNKYSGNEIDKTLFKTWGKKFSSHNKLASNKVLANKITSEIENFKGDQRFCFSEYIDITDYSVIGATTTTSSIAGKKGIELLKEYKWLIIDEVSKCPITEVLRYLPYIEKIIMVGDDFQLAPLLEFSKEQVKELPSYDADTFEMLQEIYQKSVFADTIKKAKKADRLVELNVNYRSLPDVLNAYNIFYGFSLESERLNVNPHKVAFNEKLDYLNENDIAFVFVKGGKEVTDNKTMSRYNVEELEATKDVLRNLISNTLNPSNVTVSAIFPYAAQISKFTKENRELINKAKKTFKYFDVDTVDAFQGKESDIVLVNTVVTDLSKRNFLSDFRRINVSMSRAKDKLIIFGNPLTLSRLNMNVNDGTKRTYFKEIIEDIRRKGIMMNYSSKGGIEIELTSNAKTKVKKAK